MIMNSQYTHPAKDPARLVIELKAALPGQGVVRLQLSSIFAEGTSADYMRLYTQRTALSIGSNLPRSTP